MASKLPIQKQTGAASCELPAQIEIFRAGRHTDDSGTVHNFSAADVAGMVAAYDPALREAPLTIGHPAHNLPAYGWVKGLEVNAAGNLAMHTHQVAPQFAEMVGNKAFKKRSASFYPPQHANNPKQGAWYLRHVAFLGAQPPAIAGLADFADNASVAVFADTNAEGAVSFSEASPDLSATPPVIPITKPTVTTPEPTQMDKDLQAQLDAANAKQAATDAALAKATQDAADATAQLAQFAESAKRDRTAGFVSFADSQIKAGKLLPKDKDAAVAVLGTLADAQPVSFAEGGATKTIPAADWLKALIENAKPLVSFSEQAAGNAGTAQAGSGNGKTDAEIDVLAKAYQRQNKVSYAEALSVICTFTS